MRRYIVSGMSKVVLMARIISYLLRRINMDLLIYAYRFLYYSMHLLYHFHGFSWTRRCYIREKGSSNVSHGLFDEPLAEGAGVGEVDGEL